MKWVNLGFFALQAAVSVMFALLLEDLAEPEVVAVEKYHEDCP